MEARGVQLDVVPKAVAPQQLREEQAEGVAASALIESYDCTRRDSIWRLLAWR